MSICALAFISCQKEEVEGIPSAEGKFTYEFVASHLPEAKATIGDKVDSQWPVLWSKGDQMGVYKADGTFVGVATVSDDSEGKNSGKFSVQSNVGLAAGDNLYFSYPYVADAAISTGKIYAEQTLGAAGVGANAIAYATAQYNPGNTQFVLTHANAYLKFNIKSEEFAGYNLTGVTLWADGTQLAGGVTIADGGTLTVSAPEDYVKASLATPVAVGASDAQTVCVAALPADLTEKTVYAIVHMKGTGAKATETVELPVRLNGAGSLNAGAVTEITLPSLARSLAPKWYEPVETRYVADYGKGWSYGEENTVLFTQGGVNKTVSLKARGNFMKVKEPKYVQVFMDTCFGSSFNLVQFDDTKVSFSAEEKTDHEITAEDYSVKMKMTKTTWYKVNEVDGGQLAKIVIKDADKNIIWGMNLWLALNPFVVTHYANGKVLDRNIGSDFAVSETNQHDERTHGVYFQWGRPFAIPYAYSARGLTIDVADNCTSLAVSTSNPNTMYYYNTKEPYDWYYKKGALDDLWGNSVTNTSDKSGYKSIYDPCPKGYRVVSPAVLNEVYSNVSATLNTSTGELTSTGATEINKDKTVYFLKYNGVTWGFAGGFFNDGWNSKVHQNNRSKTIAAYWSNSNDGTTKEYGSCMLIRLMKRDGSAWVWEKINKKSKAGAYPVRCMVDEDNR